MCIEFTCLLRDCNLVKVFGHKLHENLLIDGGALTFGGALLVPGTGLVLTVKVGVVVGFGIGVGWLV